MINCSLQTGHDSVGLVEVSVIVGRDWMNDCEVGVRRLLWWWWWIRRWKYGLSRRKLSSENSDGGG